MKEAADRYALFKDEGPLRIASEDVDPRGWHLLCSDGGVFGAVTDLIADQESMRISHLVSEVYDATPQRVLLPTSFARFDNHNHTVIYDALTREEIDELPAFRGLPIDPADEERILALLTNDNAVRELASPATPMHVVDRRKGERRHH